MPMELRWLHTDTSAVHSLPAPALILLSFISHTPFSKWYRYIHTYTQHIYVSTSSYIQYVFMHNSTHIKLVTYDMAELRPNVNMKVLKVSFVQQNTLTTDSII